MAVQLCQSCKGEKMKKIEYYTVKPNLKQLFGRKVTKELEFDEYTEDKKVHQILKDCVLTTYITSEEQGSVYGVKDKVITKEETKIVQNIPEGVILLWSEKSGYIIPDIQMTTLEELEKDIKDIKEIYKVGDENDTTRNEETDS